VYVYNNKISCVSLSTKSPSIPVCITKISANWQKVNKKSGENRMCYRNVRQEVIKKRKCDVA